MENNKPTVARIALVLAMTDGTCRYMLIDGNWTGIENIFCMDEEDAAELMATEVGVNPAWYRAR